MNVKILIVLLFAHTSAWGLCLPDTSVVPSGANLKPQIEEAADLFLDEAKSLIPKEYNLVIQMDSLNPKTNAEITKDGTSLVISVMGGMLSNKHISEKSMTLLLCHELGHFLGGDPKKSRGGWSSTEGQADYYSGERCARFMGLDEASLIEGALELTQLYASVTRETTPSLECSDNNSVTRTNYGYPSVQCRLDTIIAGWRGFNRPKCWYRE